MLFQNSMKAVVVVAAAQAMHAAPAAAQANDCGTQVGRFEVVDNGATIGSLIVAGSGGTMTASGEIGGVNVLYSFAGCIAANLAVFTRAPDIAGPPEIALEHDQSGNDDMFLHYKEQDGSDVTLNLLNEAS